MPAIPMPQFITPTYDSPDIQELSVELNAIICESPQPGGNEDIGFEDWNL